MSNNAKFWLIFLAVVIVLFFVVPGFMKDALLLFSLPLALILFLICLPAGIESLLQKRKEKKAQEEEWSRTSRALSALEYSNFQSRGNYYNGLARVKLAEHRYSYVKNVDGRDVAIKPDSTFHKHYDPVSNKTTTIEIRHANLSNIFEEAEEFTHQSAIVNRGREAALLGKDGKYIIPFNEGFGETASSELREIGGGCLEYHKTRYDKETQEVLETIYKTINRDGITLYNGAPREQHYKDGRLIVWEGTCTMEIDPQTGKIIVPLNVYNYVFENGSVLIYTIKENLGWNVFSPITQKYLFDKPYQSIAFLDKRNLYLTSDDNNIRVFDEMGQIVTELLEDRILYVYDQRYFIGYHKIVDIEGSDVNGLYLDEIVFYYDKNETKEYLRWFKNPEPRRVPKQPPFSKNNEEKILFIQYKYNYAFYLLALEGNRTFGRNNYPYEPEYAPDTHRIVGFKAWNDDLDQWEHYSITGDLKWVEDLEQIPGLKESDVSIIQEKEESLQQIKNIEKTSCDENNRYLFFDTETTGLPQNFDAPISDLDNWPRLVQLSWIVTNAEGKELRVKDFIIRPNGFTIPEVASKVNGITTEIAVREGSILQDVLADFFSDLESINVIVGHNVEFDKKIVGAEFLRCNIGCEPLDKPTVCTMESSTDYCALPGKFGYKWPTLQELHNKLFGYSFEDAHNSLNDIKATKKCFFELKKRNII